jgi:hypothetical protein
VISKDVDGGPPPAITITTYRRVNDFGAWYIFSTAAGTKRGPGNQLDSRCGRRIKYSAIGIEWSANKKGSSLFGMGSNDLSLEA